MDLRVAAYSIVIDDDRRMLLAHWNDNKVCWYKFCQARKFKLDDAP